MVAPMAEPTLSGLLPCDLPHRPAVIDPTEELSRGALVDRADRLRGVLVELGVTPGARVGIRLETSAWTMATVHAVLGAGGVVVPIDPRAPTSMVESILEQCGIDVLVTDQREADRADLVERSGLTSTVGPGGLDRSTHRSWADVSDHRREPPIEVRGNDRAYVIFTSGSTGPPKGIVHTHASGRRYAELAVETYGVGPDDRIVQVAALHFDQSTFGCYAGPLAGAATIMVPEAVLAFPASVVRLVSEQRATIWYSVPTLLMRLVQRGGAAEADLSSLRWVKFGGEVYPPALVREAMAAASDARFSNVYGPAEVNQCTYHHLDGPPMGTDPVPIGRPWPDTELLVVDDRGTPVRPGATGELFVRTTTAMAGYWGRPDLTERSFRTVAGHQSGAGPWYATGDLVHEDASGNLVFRGRLDHQVKVRGHRVELEAVESELAQLPGVDAVGVIVVTEHDGTARLIAGIEADDGVDPTELRRSLGAVLPSFAVPDVIIRDPELPRTTSGKVDRRALEERYRPVDAGSPPHDHRRRQP
jgi:amino acid adenylation domain-containing protein